MISYIKGELIFIAEDSIIIENSGIGYEIRVPVTVTNKLPVTGKKIQLYTYLYVREDALQLYGFLTKDDLSIFQLLITVNGIGPRGALGILSAITPDDLRFAILTDDAKAITKAPGIGSKTAKKLILELKDKLHLEDNLENSSYTDGSSFQDSSLRSIRDDAVQALVALGYPGTDAMRAVRKVDITEEMKVEDVLKASLRKILG